MEAMLFDFLLRIFREKNRILFFIFYNSIIIFYNSKHYCSFVKR